MNLDEQIAFVGCMAGWFPDGKLYELADSLRELKRLREVVARFVVEFEHGDPTDQDALDRAFAALKESPDGQ